MLYDWQYDKTSHPTYRWRTLVHDVGHGMFSLFYPDDKGAKNDELDGTTDADQYNFMNNGNIYDKKTVKKINQYRIRKYQWIKMN